MNQAKKVEGADATLSIHHRLVGALNGEDKAFEVLVAAMSLAIIMAKRLGYDPEKFILAIKQAWDSTAN